jgi:hypothetical protein
MAQQQFINDLAIDEAWTECVELELATSNSERARGSRLREEAKEWLQAAFGNL